MGKLPIIAIIGSLGFFRAVLLPLLFLARAYFCGGMVAFSSADEPTRVDCGTVFIGLAVYLKARPSGLASPSLPTGEGEATTIASITQHAQNSHSPLPAR
jgi:hypothetical protein